MSYANKRLASPIRSLQPAPRVLVSCQGVNGEKNVLAVGYCCNCSYDPPMVIIGIVPKRYSHQLIKETGCFVVNLVDQKYQGTFDYMGSHSGRDGDKLAAKDVKSQPGEKVIAPILLDCPVNIECTVVNSFVTGSHEMFVGKVECVHADSELVNEKGEIDFSQINFIP